MYSSQSVTMPNISTRWWVAVLVGLGASLISSAIGTVLAVMVVSAMTGVTPTSGEVPESMILTGVIFGHVLLLATIWAYLRWIGKQSPWLALGLGSLQANWRLPVLGGLAGILLTKLLFVLAVSQIGDQEHVFTQIVQGGTWLELAMVLAIGVIAAPLAEEVIWRGFIFSSMGQRWGYMTGGIVSSLLFGLIHAPEGIGSAINAVLLGLVLAWAYRNSGSLWVPIGLHAASNLAQFGVVLWL